LPFHSESEENGHRLWGEIYPVRLHDTYAVDLTLRYEEIVDWRRCDRSMPQTLSKLPSDKRCYYLPNPSTSQNPPIKTLLLIACDRCLQTKPHYPLISSRTTFRQSYLEYDNDQENPTQRRHVLVWLNANPETHKQLQQGEVYQTFYHAC
jgi:hypothetical protein